MADITARLVWYKLTEKYSDVCEKYERFLDWYEDFSWSRVDFLDMLFLGWLLAAFVVVGAVNLYLRFFAHPKSKRSLTGGGVSTKNGESLEWFNAIFSWLFHHYNNTPEFVDAWLKAVNEHARKQQYEYQIKVDSIQTGSPPPKLSHVSTDSSGKDYLMVHVGVESTGESTLLVSAIQQSPTSIRVTNCDVAILKLKGQLKVQSSYNKNTEQIQINMCFASTPEISMQVRPKQIDSKVKLKEVEEALKNSISSCVTTVTLPANGGYPNFYPGFPTSQDNQIQTSKKVKKGQSTTTPEIAKSTAQDFTAAVRAASPGGTLRHRKLLVKVIKANGLGDKDFACSGPYCTVQTDEPQQRHITSVVKNTVNPFWDEHFVFDLNDETKHIKFEVYDREKTIGSDFLGRAIIAMNELKRLPSSRQIVPLTGKPGATTTSGSVTVEFLFMESPESQQPFSNVNKSDIDGISPRRRIETNRTVTPGGTFVTTTTTTTERPRGNIEAGYNDVLESSPSKIEKSETSSNYTAEYSPYSSRSSHLGAHEAGLTGSQTGTARSTQLPSPSLTITPSGGIEQNLTPEQQHRDDLMDYNRSPSPIVPHENRATPVSASDSDAEVKKSKSFASTLKRKFQRNKDKSKRSQSADRASSFRESDLLRPPGDRQTGGRLSGDLEQSEASSEFSTQSLKRDRKRSSLRNLFPSKKTSSEDYDSGSTEIPEAGLQKNRQRSRSFSSSLKKLFKGKKKEGGMSRESSVSRQSTKSAQGTLTISREGSSQPSPQMYRQPSPDTPSHDFPYSSSVPVGTSPLYDQYSTR